MYWRLLAEFSCNSHEIHCDIGLLCVLLTILVNSCHNTRWRLIEIRPAIALAFHDGDMWKASVIYRATFLYIFFNFSRGWYSGTLLKYQNWNLYKVIGRIYILYSSHLCVVDKPLVKFPNIFMSLILNNTLLV